jgi:hypothetical protein
MLDLLAAGLLFKIAASAACLVVFSLILVSILGAAAKHSDKKAWPERKD